MLRKSLWSYSYTMRAYSYRVELRKYCNPIRFTSPLPLQKQQRQQQQQHLAEASFTWPDDRALFRGIVSLYRRARENINSK